MAFKRGHSFIYAPHEKSANGKTITGGDDSPITVPSPVYSYPPKSHPTNSQVKKKKKRFAFLRKGNNSKKSGSGANGANDNGSQKSWEDDWEPGEYPFVRMEGHRATCAICLMDFDEPPRVHGAAKKTQVEGGEDQVQESSGVQTPADSNGVEEVQVEEVTQEDSERVQLQDAGEGPQPLRLLSCGHAFHVSYSTIFLVCDLWPNAYIIRKLALTLG